MELGLTILFSILFITIGYNQYKIYKCNKEGHIFLDDKDELKFCTRCLRVIKN